MGTSLSIAASAFDKPNSSAAFAACGLVSFIWPSSAPTSSTGDVPPIFSWMYFQLHSFSRLMSRIFSVRSARVMGVSLAFDCVIVGALRASSRLKLGSAADSVCSLSHGERGGLRGYGLSVVLYPPHSNSLLEWGKGAYRV